MIGESALLGNATDEEALMTEDLGGCAPEPTENMHKTNGTDRSDFTVLLSE